MNIERLLRLFLLNVLLLGVLTSNGQDPKRFEKQVEKLSNKQHNFSPDKKLVVFTGSSSIVRWKDLHSVFPGYNIINNGFGGSQFSDLIYFYDKLILNAAPEILFIYEGDNDIAKGKKPSFIFKEAKGLISQIQSDLPQTKVVLISPKPCIANWSKKDEYIKLNKKLEKLCKRRDNLEFADVWKVMVDEKGIVYQDIFVEDGDHMNNKGYKLWVKAIGEFLQQ